MKKLEKRTVRKKYGKRGKEGVKKCCLCERKFTFTIDNRPPNSCPECNIILFRLSRRFIIKRYRLKRKNDIIDRSSQEGVETKIRVGEKKGVR